MFWFGDFNFRLSKERVEVENIMSRIDGGEMAPLLEHDQLTKEINDGTLAYNMFLRGSLLCCHDRNPAHVLLSPSRLNL